MQVTPLLELLEAAVAGGDYELVVQAADCIGEAARQPHLPLVTALAAAAAR